MDKTLIIILAVILFILVLLNNLKFVITNVYSVSDRDIKDGNCSQTKFGCCPDGVNSKIDYYGTNCPNYNPGEGYPDNEPDAVIVTNS
jgi:hypothetical protein